VIDVIFCTFAVCVIAVSYMLEPVKNRVESTDVLREGK
jgi:hypothetical protein